MAESSRRTMKMERPPATDEPFSKRSKASTTVRGEDDYMPGSIIEMELSNFMTYGSLFCKPAPRLNLVIGPNGSGKSSIVCAIALGLCGEPQLLGRATSIGAYVKRGEDSGYIKITLKGSSNNEKITITRKIDTRNKSEWLFNGKLVSKKEVSQVIQRFNIQVNNLTQFLPQDRVCEFAKLSPVQLLEETEKAVGDPQLPIQHCALVEKSRELKNIELAVKRNGETLQQLRALNAELEKDVERVRQRDELLAKAELMKKKLPWLEYDKQQAEYEKAKILEMDADKKLKKAAKELKHFSEPIEKKKTERVLLEDDCKQADNIVKDNARRRRQHQDRANHLEVQLRGKCTEIEDLRREEASRKQNLLKVEKDLSAAEIELQNCPISEPPKEALSRLASQISELRVSINDTRSLKTEREKLLLVKGGALAQQKNRLKKMGERQNKILYALKNTGTEKIMEAHSLIQQHQNELKKHVYGPVLLEVNVSNEVHADYLESRVPYYIWKSFITQDPSDRDFLVRKLKGYDIPILNCLSDENSDQGSFKVPDKMRELGIYSRLDQVFDAPDAIKKVLISQCGLDLAYIGSKESAQRANEVPKVGIIDLWTPENHYHWKKSRYSDHVTASLDPISRSRLISGSLSTGETEKLHQSITELQKEVSAIQASVDCSKKELVQLENEESKLHRKREEITDEAKHETQKRLEIQNRIDRNKRKLQSLKHGSDFDRRMANLIDDARKFNIQRVQCAMEMKNLLLEAISCKRSYAAIQMASIEFDAKVREMEINLKEHKKVAEEAAVHLQDCKDEVERQRKQLIVVKKHAESVAVLTEDLGRAFLKMPTTVEELRAAIQDNTSQANSILFLNQNVLEEYEHRRQKIETMDKKLEADIDEQKRCLEEIDELKASWLPKLRNLVAQINGTFSRNFQEMAVAGEVSLGMDPINERKMFQQLVRAASQPNTPQCFLLTPKLLPDLEYSEACSILNIMNGPWIDQPSKGMELVV
ncbi:Structural maintenance of chromosomes protein 5 [Linum grandiflorum]